MILDNCCPRLPAERLGTQLKVVCCFCQETHWHGLEYGHRWSHCNDSGRKVDPRDARTNRGYILCEPTNDVNWEFERLLGRLIVLRNKRRRLISEAGALIPLDAHNIRIRNQLRGQADEIAGIFAQAGVDL